MTLKRIAQITIFPALLTIVLIVSVAGFYVATAALYAATGHAPPPVLAQIINTVLGALSSILIMVGVITYITSRPEAQRRWMGIAEPIIVALERIAKGDFQVRVDTPPFGSNTLVSGLANSVNQVAIELSQMEHLRQEFISDVSHEIQSPLTSIRGFAQALRDDHLSASERHHYLEIIETESTRLSRLTDNMLKLASLESEHMRIESKPYRLDKQIRTVLLACEPQWAGKSIEMDVALDELVVCADEDVLSQVWINLLNNSIKFTPEGGKISVEAHQQGSHVECTITDTGIGIPTEAQTHIFDRFYKADKSRERSCEGSGLGLAIVKKIVELHHGAIGVASQPGAGATFVVSLPAD